MENESKEYDVWNELKKKIQFKFEVPTYFPQEGEVWMSSLGKNIGHEQNGSGDNFSRPVLVIKKFNNHMFWCVPLSTKQKPFDFYFNFTDPNNEKVSVIFGSTKTSQRKKTEKEAIQYRFRNICKNERKTKEFYQIVETPLSRGFSEPFGTLYYKYVRNKIKVKQIWLKTGGSIGISTFLNFEVICYLKGL